MSRAAEGTAPELPRQANDEARRARAARIRREATRGHAGGSRAARLHASAREAWAGRLGPMARGSPGRPLRSDGGASRIGMPTAATPTATTLTSCATRSEPSMRLSVRSPSTQKRPSE